MRQGCRALDLNLAASSHYLTAFSLSLSLSHFYVLPLKLAQSSFSFLISSSSAFEDHHHPPSFKDRQTNKQTVMSSLLAGTRPNLRSNPQPQPISASCSPSPARAHRPSDPTSSSCLVHQPKDFDEDPEVDVSLPPGLADPEPYF